ncbi:MAG: hypothetical protein VST68_04220 [Nitrospirota bacterium]|nr:hypothetical protein [Nitrospirota bacterium]
MLNLIPHDLGAWFDWLLQLINAGQALPLLAVFIVAVLTLYFFGLLLSMIIPIWRRHRTPPH